MSDSSGVGSEAAVTPGTSHQQPAVLTTQKSSFTNSTASKSSLATGDPYTNVNVPASRSTMNSRGQRTNERAHAANISSASNVGGAGNYGPGSNDLSFRPGANGTVTLPSQNTNTGVPIGGILMSSIVIPQSQFNASRGGGSILLGSQNGDNPMGNVGGASLSRSIARRLHPFTLTFREADMEREYERFFLEKHLASWRRTMYLLFSAATCCYAYVMIRNPGDGRRWSRMYSDPVKGLNTREVIASICPTGWFCMSCDPDYICNEYHLEYDLAFWICCILLPCLLLVIASYKLRPTHLATYIHALSALFIIAYAAIGLIVRYDVVEPRSPVFQPALLCIMFIFVSCMFMRLRFIYAVGSVSVTVILFFAVFISDVASGNSELLPSTAKTYIMSVLALLVSGAVISSNTYENEVFSRAQFSASYTLEKANVKLTNQLKGLQKAYGNKVADLDSPLEKSVMLLRSMMADPSNSPAHLVTIAQILTLLASSNLLAPDLENQVGELLDNEQEQWLFTEIAPRRKGRDRMSSRRRSITADISAKIDMPIAESTSIANMINLSVAQFRQTSGTASEVNRSVDHVSLVANGERNGERMTDSQPILSSDRTRLSRTSVASRGNTGSDRQDSTRQYQSGSNNASASILALIQQGSFGASNSPFWQDEFLSPSPELAMLLARCNEYNWPIFDFLEASKGRPLFVLGYHLFKRAELFAAFNIPPDIFRNFLTAIESGYRTDLPYHNSIHASDVLQCTNHFLYSHESVCRLAGDIDLLSIYVAAIIHDHEHPGFNNNFLVNTYDSRAVMYNDRSVLENHHLASAFVVMNKTENNFLVNLSRQDFRSVREAVIDMVLATDLSQHFPLISTFKSKVTSNFDPYETREDRMLLWKILIKCADVSNPTKCWALYERWCHLILEEFFRQGDQEKRMGIPVSPYMDRDNLNIPSSQSGFIEFVVSPLFEAFDKYAPIPHIIQTLQRNREFWIAMKAQGTTNTIPTSGPSTSTHFLVHSPSQAHPQSPAASSAMNPGP